MKVEPKRHRVPRPVRGRTSVLLLAIAAACGGETPTAWDGEGVLGEYILYEDWKRSYALHLPPDYDPARPAPLLIMFHGAGDTGPWFQGWTGLDAYADEAGFITVYPNGTPIGGCIDDPPECDPGPPYYWVAEDIGFTRELIAHLEDGLAIDSDRIFAAGMSNGSLFTYDLACQVAEVFAAVATVAALPRPSTANNCDPSRPIPILVIHGTEDSTFPWNGEHGHLSMEENLSMWTDLNGCTGDPAVQWLPDIVDEGTRAWTETWDNCDAGVQVKLIGIDGGGHIWPGVQFEPDLGFFNSDVSASAEIVHFFSQHSMGQRPGSRGRWIGAALSSGPI